MQSCGTCRYSKFDAGVARGTCMQGLLMVPVERHYGGSCNVYSSINPPDQVSIPFKQEYLNPPKKEEQMSTTLIRLADASFNKEVVDLGGMNINIKAALEEVQAEEDKAMAKAAATEINNLLKLANHQVEEGVALIRINRKKIEVTKNALNNLAKAKTYGIVTSNYVPLAVALGVLWEHQVKDKSLLVIDESKLVKSGEAKPDTAAV